MADQKPTSQNYQNLGGINKKVSEYNLNQTEFDDLRNLDFFVPNALTKRPGSTGFVSGLSSKVSSLHEHQFLNGTNIVLGQITNTIGYVNFGTSTFNFTPLMSPVGSSYFLISNQQVDYVSFLDQVFYANGQVFGFVGPSLISQNMPIPLTPAQLSAIGATSGTVVSTGGTHTILLAYYAQYLGNPDGSVGFKNAQYGPLIQTGGFNDLGARLSGSYIVKAGATVAVTNFGETLFNNYIVPGVSHLALFLFATNDLSILANQQFNYGEFKSQEDFFSIVDKIKFFTLYPIPGLSTTAYYGVNATLLLGTAFGSFNTTSTFSYTGIGYVQATAELPVITGNFFQTYTPKYLEVNNNRLLITGFSAAPSSVVPSELINPYIYKAENLFEVRTNDGDVISGIKTYNDETLIFKRKSFYRLLGDNPSNYSISEVSLEYGCLNNKTIIEFKERLAWLDRQGIVLYNGSTYEVISTKIEPIFRRMNFTAAETQACAVHFNNRNQVWFGIPIDGSQVNNITLVYDYLIQAWTIFDGFNPASFYYTQNTGTPRVIMGDYSGMIRSFSESLFSDLGQGISCKMLTRFESNDGENSTNIYRRFFLNVQPEVGSTQAMNVKAYSNYDSTTVQATFQMFQSTFQSRAEIGVVGKSVQFEVNHVSASLPLEINGFGISRRFLRNV